MLLSVVLILMLICMRKLRVRLEKLFLLSSFFLIECFNFLFKNYWKLAFLHAFFLLTQN